MPKLINLILSKNFIVFSLIAYAISISIQYNLKIPSTLTEGDALSYIDFSFDNIEIIFTQHRTFGLPLLINLFEFFSPKFYYWGYFNLILFLFSVYVLYFALVKTGFHKILASSTIYGILLTYNLYYYFDFINTDIAGLSFFLLSISNFLLFVHLDKKINLFLFSILIFFCIFIRPSYILSVPCFLFYFYRLNTNIFEKKNIMKYVQYLFISNILIIFYILLRLFYAGNLGLVSFSGVLSSNHLTFLAEPDQLQNISIENRDFIKQLINRRNNVEGECNISYREAKINNIDINDHRSICYNDHLMSAWLEKIKLNLNLEPFPSDDPKNYSAWKYKGLSEFFNIKDNVEIDNQLKSATKEVIYKNKKEYLNIVLESLFKQSFIKYMLAIKYLIIIFIFGYFLLYTYKNTYVLDTKTKAFFEFNLIHYITLSLLTSFMNFPEERFFIAQSILLLPSTFFYFGHLFLKK
ncbi:MAG: hypothetical protein CMI90_05760 [Pelagibacteraceae bacterium]|jgi:hypothetical protein|nr:hypothetical protein [Pelagibacteraceae bacterium]